MHELQKDTKVKYGLIVLILQAENGENDLFLTVVKEYLAFDR